MMCEPTSNAEVVRVDVAVPDHDTEKEPTNVSATVEYWQSALQEFCKNSPPQHAYVANPLAATPQAYGLWSGQIPPVKRRRPSDAESSLQPLLTPYGPMPFFGGFFPGAYPIPTPAAVPTVSLPAVKPEVNEEGEKDPAACEVQSTKRRKPPATSPSAASPPPAHYDPAQPHATPTLMNRKEDLWIKVLDDSSSPVDDRELKKERRKQSNRESARRSRLRKQRECESLQKQVQDLSAINGSLEQELSQLKQRLAELEQENAQLKGNWSAP